MAKEPAKQSAPFANEIAAFEKWDRQNAVPRDAILFVGSSTIRMWQTADAFPELPIINRGFGGSTIADVNFYPPICTDTAAVSKPGGWGPGRPGPQWRPRRRTGGRGGPGAPAPPAGHAPSARVGPGDLWAPLA